MLLPLMAPKDILSSSEVWAQLFGELKEANNLPFLKVKMFYKRKNTVLLRLAHPMALQLLQHLRRTGLFLAARGLEFLFSAVFHDRS